VRQALSLPLLGCFVRALEALHSPEARFEDWKKDALLRLHPYAAPPATKRGGGSAAAAAAPAPPLALQRALFLDLLSRCFYLAASQLSRAVLGGAPGLRVPPERWGGGYVLGWQQRWFKHVVVERLGVTPHRRGAGGPAGAALEARADAWVDEWAFAGKITYESVRRCGEGVGGDDPSKPLRGYGAGDGKISQLRELSAWLADYRAADWPASAAIELPGQYDRYDGSAPPDPASHACLRLLEPALLTMSSLRKPKRVGMVTDGERLHRFLAKGGEDIRCDQRVEQLLRAMTRVLDGQSRTRSRGLGRALRTFAVVPMSASIGLIEWVDRTVPIKAVVEAEANARLALARSRLQEVHAYAGRPRDGAGGGGAGSSHTAAGTGGRRGAAASAAAAAHTAPAIRGGDRVASAALLEVARQQQGADIPRWHLGVNDAVGVRNAFLQRYCRGGSPDLLHSPETYKAVYAAAGAEEACRTWASVMRHMPLDLLRSRLLGMAAAPDAGIAARGTFIRSLSAFSVAAYLLGLGDRHLDNWLLSERDGAIVPIDFGAVFGAATTQLGVPETFPLRMSGQFLGVMYPLSGAAVVQAAMSATLGALSAPAPSANLLSVMDVFAREPTLDWQQQAQRRALQAPARPAEGAKGGRAGPAAAAGGSGGADGTAGQDSGSAGTADAVEPSAGVWFPRVRMLLARLKLQRRANPAPLLYADALQNAALVPGPAQRYAAGSVGAAQAGSAGAPASRLLEMDRLLAGVHAAVAGSHAPHLRPRAQAANALPLRLGRSEERLLQAALGGPLTGNKARGGSAHLDVTLLACPTVEAQVACLLDFATDPNVLIRQWTGLALWV
jgi:hypothetical protein